MRDAPIASGPHRQPCYLPWSRNLAPWLLLLVRTTALAEQMVGRETIDRYTDQGYVYVGRVDQAPAAGSSGGAGLAAGTTATKAG